MKTLRFALQIALGIALPLLLQRWHRGRLPPAQRAFAWNGATWGAALYAFGPFSLLGWFWVTRRALPFGRAGRALAGVGLGVAASALVSLAIAGIDRVVAAGLGLPP
ncbi:MAG: transcriptional regulator [Polyangiaceae bacterium]|nr:transcriptional regulator [Polyangiaceae bacterium]